MVSGITPCARECKWIVYFGETPNREHRLDHASQLAQGSQLNTLAYAS